MPSVWPQTMPQLCIALDQVPIPEWNVEVIVISKLRDDKSKRAKVVYTSYLAIFIRGARLITHEILPHDI